VTDTLESARPEKGLYVAFYEGAARVKRDRCLRCPPVPSTPHQRSMAIDPGLPRGWVSVLVHAGLSL
jgi:hypothetical protein